MMFSKRERRFFQRGISGIKAAWYHHEYVRFLTIGSLYTDNGQFQKSFLALVKRIRRRYGRFDYLLVKELTGLGHVHGHILFRGKFIPHDWLVEQWADITGQSSANVHVKLVRDNAGKVIRYMLKYLSKNMLYYGFSHEWIFKGASRVWELIKKRYLPDVKLAILKFEELLAPRAYQVHLGAFGVPYPDLPSVCYARVVRDGSPSDRYWYVSKR